MYSVKLNAALDCNQFGPNLAPAITTYSDFDCSEVQLPFKGVSPGYCAFGGQGKSFKSFRITCDSAW